MPPERLLSHGTEYVRVDLFWSAQAKISMLESQRRAECDRASWRADEAAYFKHERDDARLILLAIASQSGGKLQVRRKSLEAIRPDSKLLMWHDTRERCTWISVDETIKDTTDDDTGT